MFGLRKKHIAKNLKKNMSKRLKVSQIGKKGLFKSGNHISGNCACLPDND